MKVFSILNKKGGTGKTTTSINLAYGLAQKGYKTLLIDADSQANATLSLGIIPSPGIPSLSKLLMKELSILDVITPTSSDLLKIIPAVHTMSKIEPILMNLKGSEYHLSQFLKQIENSFDYCIIDCAPFVGMVTLNALISTQNVIVPIKNDFLSIEGLSQIAEIIGKVTIKKNPQLTIGGVLITMYNSSEPLIHDIGRYSAKLFQSVIRYDPNLALAPKYGKPIFLYSPSSLGCIDFSGFTDEFIRWF